MSAYRRLVKNSTKKKTLLASPIGQFRMCSRTTSHTQIPPVTKPKTSVDDKGHSRNHEAIISAPPIKAIAAHSSPPTERCADFVCLGSTTVAQSALMLRRLRLVSELTDHIDLANGIVVSCSLDTPHKQKR